jgi:hypothetical protein
MHNFTSSALALLGGIVVLTAQAADPKLQELPEPPPMSESQPATDAPADSPEPEITITTHGTERYEEYRVRGQLYMIKVTPVHGKPYYLIDNEGSGQFSRSDFAPSIKVPMWVIKRF